MGRLVLGSGSPRRQRLMREAGYDFEVVVTDAGEIADSADPAGTVAHNALAKLAACRRLRPDADILAADTLVAHLADLGYRHLVFTDISRDGMQTGIDADAYRHIAKVAGFPVVASGGIATLDDIRALTALGPDVIEGAITGRALYEGSFTLEDALAAAVRRA